LLDFILALGGRPAFPVCRFLGLQILANGDIVVWAWPRQTSFNGALFLCPLVIVGPRLRGPRVLAFLARCVLLPSLVVASFLCATFEFGRVLWIVLVERPIFGPDFAPKNLGVGRDRNRRCLRLRLLFFGQCLQVAFEADGGRRARVDVEIWRSCSKDALFRAGQGCPSSSSSWDIRRRAPRKRPGLQTPRRPSDCIHFDAGVIEKSIHEPSRLER
jgi:hypothetical protein